MTTLLKRSALSGVYRMNGAKTTTVAGWEIAESFGDASREQRQLADGAVLVDWWHIGKRTLSRGMRQQSRNRGFPEPPRPRS